MESKEPTPVELLKMFADGAKIRHKNWYVGTYVCLRDGKFIDERGVDIRLTLNLSSVLDGDYELYREPKKLKRYWLWDIKTEVWSRYNTYISEDGHDTLNNSVYPSGWSWNQVEKRKAEPEQFIDVEASE